MTLVKTPPPLSQEVDLSKPYDAVVVGSGAAGGMAAHVLTEQGMNVLMLEAGKKLPIEQELRSMQWPYEHPRRGDAPPGYHSLSFNEYTIRTPPYAKGSTFKHVMSYVGGWGGSDYVKNILVDEKDHPYSGTKYAWVRARALGGKTNIWGRLALRLSDYDFKAKTHDDYGDDWPISYADIEPYYDRVDRYLGISGVKENLPHLTIRTNSSAHEVLVDPNTGKARGVAFVDSGTRKSYEAKAKVVIVGASTLESARLLLLSRSPQHPNGIGNSSGHVGHNFCEHVMGPGVTGLVKEQVGKPHTLDDGRPGGFYVPRFRNLKDRQPGFIRGYGFEGRGGPRDVRGRGDSSDQHGRQDAHGGVVDPRAGHGAHGDRSEDVRAESIPAVPRREEPVCRRRLQSRERVVSEPHVDDHGAGV